MDERVFDFMKRNVAALKEVEQIVEKPDKTKATYFPFNVSLNLKNSKSYNLNVMNGGVYDSVKKNNYPLRGLLQVRMGDPIKGGSKGDSTFRIPENVSKEASDFSFNEAAKVAFWRSAKDFEKRFSGNLGQRREREDFLYYSNELKENFIQTKNPVEINIPEIENMFRNLSREFNTYGILGNDLSFEFTEVDNYFYDSNCSKVFTTDSFYSTYLEFFAKSKDGLIIPHVLAWRSKDLPSYEFLLRKGQENIKQLEKIVKAPREKNGEYPIILCGENAGVLFHEVIGHGLEGHRYYLTGEEETNLFKEKMGQKIAPSQLNLSDDPSMNEFNGQKIISSYIYDDEGVKAQRVELIKGGVLTDLLHSRESAGYFKRGSNGHSRYSHENTRKPHPRMGVLVAESTNPVSFEDMKKMLMAECERAEKPYGLYIKGKSHGWVATTESFYNTYAKEAFRIYKNGTVKRVQGINVVGTPHNTLSNIVAMSDNPVLENGFCGAESGIVTQSIISPDVLIEGLEVKRIPKDEYGIYYENILNKK